MRLLRRIAQVGSALSLLGAGIANAQDGIFNVENNLSSMSVTSPNDSERSQEFEISRNDVPGANQFFSSRYGLNVNADSKGVSTNKLVNAVHEISFEVHSSRGFTLVISSGWVGEIARQADTANCSDAAVVSGVTGEVIAGFGLSNGTLSLADPPDVTIPDQDDRIIQLSDVADAQIRVANPSPTEFFRLRFSWSASVLSNTCEVAVRLGADNRTITECTTCEYPGDPARTKSEDGHFVNVQFFPSPCGNGQLDSGEECDLGTGNGFGACCDIFCKLEPEDMPCAPDDLFCTGDGRCHSGICDPLGDPCVGEPCAVCDEETDSCVPCTPAPTATEGSTPTSTPATPPPGSCAGDCDGDGSVEINELVIGVAIALDRRPLADCASFDADGSSSVGIAELVQAVGKALRGCS